MKSPTGIAYALISSSTFGLIPLFALPIILSGNLGNPSILLYRFGLGTLMIGIIGAFQRKSFRINWKQGLKLLFLGWFYAATALWLTRSYSMLPSGVATTIHFLYPIVVATIMVTFFREARSFYLLGAAVLSLVGVGMLNSGGADINYLGILTVLVTVITYAIYIVGVNKSGVGTMDPIPLTFYVLLSGTLMFTVNAALSADGIQVVTDSHTWLNLVLLAFIPTVISDITLVMAIKRVGSTVTSVLGSMEPLVAVLVGVVYFHEPFSVVNSVGLLLIIISVIVVIIKSNSADPHSATPPAKPVQEIELPEIDNE